MVPRVLRGRCTRLLFWQDAVASRTEHEIFSNLAPRYIFIPCVETSHWNLYKLTHFPRLYNNWLYSASKIPIRKCVNVPLTQWPRFKRILTFGGQKILVNNVRHNLAICIGQYFRLWKEYLRMSGRRLGIFSSFLSKIGRNWGPPSSPIVIILMSCTRDFRGASIVPPWLPRVPS